MKGEKKNKALNLSLYQKSITNVGGMMTARTVKKTRLMRDAEIRFQRPLERLLPELVNQYGVLGAAAELGVSKATVGYWLLKFGIQYRRIAVSPGESL